MTQFQTLLDSLPSELIADCILNFLTFDEILFLRLIHSNNSLTRCVNEYFLTEEKFRMMNEKKIKLLKMMKYFKLCDEVSTRKFDTERRKFEFLISEMKYCNISCYRSAQLIRNVSDQEIRNSRCGISDEVGNQLPIFKITLIGPKGCGKSSLISANLLSFPVKRSDFDSNYEYHFSYPNTGTVLANVKLCEYSINSTSEESLHLDNALIDVDLFCLCFRTCNFYSEQIPTNGNSSVDNYYEFTEIENNFLPIISHYSPQTPYLVMGCATDLRSDRSYSIRTSPNDGIRFSKKIGAITYLESSIVTGYYFNYILEMLIKSTLFRKPPTRPSTRKCLLQ